MNPDNFGDPLLIFMFLFREKSNNYQSLVQSKRTNKPQTSVLHVQV